MSIADGDGSADQGAPDLLASMITGDDWRMSVLHKLRDVSGGTEAWVAAGFVRNLIWDRCFGDGGQHPLEDVDVLIFDMQDRVGRAIEMEWERKLCLAAPGVPWSVRNQARMHIRNGDRPYVDTRDAMRHWLETATGVAVRLNGGGRLEIVSAYGLADLFDGILRPTRSGLDRPDELRQRIDRKGWRTRWPGVKILLPEYLLESE